MSNRIFNTNSSYFACSFISNDTVWFGMKIAVAKNSYYYHILSISILYTKRNNKYTLIVIEKVTKSIQK